jgi:hypothetical protein
MGRDGIKPPLSPSPATAHAHTFMLAEVLSDSSGVTGVPVQVRLPSFPNRWMARRTGPVQPRLQAHRSTRVLHDMDQAVRVTGGRGKGGGGSLPEP